MHMLESTLGEEVIKAGLTKYLTRHAFKTAVTDDLWHSFEEAWTEEVKSSPNSNLDIQSIRGQTLPC